MFPHKTMRTLLLGALIVFIGCNRGGNDARHVEGPAPEDKPAASGVEWTVTSLSPEASAKYRNWQRDADPALRARVEERLRQKAFEIPAPPGRVPTASSPQQDSFGGNAPRSVTLDKGSQSVLAEAISVRGFAPTGFLAGATPQRMLDSGGVIPEMYGRYTGRLVGAMPHDASSQTPGLLSSDKSPTVWHRDRQQPTMARVYIGDGNSLGLVSLHVTTTIEGPRARTVVDHIFRNTHDKQLEGTFEYPLPTGASPSYFAMFLGRTRDTVPARFGRRDVPAPPADALAKLMPEQLVKHVDAADWGDLREGRVVNNQKAVESYEEITRARIDPALLEYAGGNTFRGRVFPIPPKGYNRVLIAYEETLPITGEQMVYRFPLPGQKLTEMNFTLCTWTAENFQPEFSPEGGKIQLLGPWGSILCTHNWKDAKPEGEIVFRCKPNSARVQAIAERQDKDGPTYLFARLRPELSQIAKDEPFARHAVFLLDTSLSEHPDRFAVNVKLMQRILEDDPDIKSFNVLTFNVGAAWVERQGWLPNTKEGRERALSRLDGLVLEGATDLGAALDKLARPGFEVSPGTPVNCFLLSDGNVTWGEADAAKLAARPERGPFACRFHCYRTGLGAENAELFEALTRKGGGMFNCFNDADLKAAAGAHRNYCLQVEKVRITGAKDVLVAGRRAAVYPGGELLVACRADGTERLTAVVEGTFHGAKYAEEFPLVTSTPLPLAGVAPRAWGELAVASLLALNDPKYDGLVTAYCQQFGIASRVASFLVLETDNDYKRFNLDQERGKTLTGDLGEFLDKTWTALAKPLTARKTFLRFLDRVETRMPLRKSVPVVPQPSAVAVPAGLMALTLGQGSFVALPALMPGEPRPTFVQKLLNVLKDEDFTFPASAIEGALLTAKDVPAAYLDGIKKDRGDVATYLTEARRRADAHDTNGAVRALSSIIEEHTGRSDALRLVGYRLLDMKQPGQAVRLFEQVRTQRPFEPHSYRDMARSLEEVGQYALAAIHYEIILAGKWHARFRNELALVAREEYVRMMQEAINKNAVSREVKELFGERVEQLSEAMKPAELRVTISWNTDNTDIDLWVMEPDGTKCFYQNQHTKSGGELSADQTQGYGPERYQIAKAPEGTFVVLVHYFGTNPNLLGGETHVNVVVTRNAGTPGETVERRTVVLKKHDELVEVCRVKK